MNGLRYSLSYTILRVPIRYEYQINLIPVAITLESSRQFGGVRKCRRVGDWPASLNTTGQVLNAFSVDNPALKRISPLSLLISTFALLEIFAYAIGMSRSGMLVYYLIRERKTLKQSWKKIIIPTIIEIGIVIVILFIESVVEWQVLAQQTAAVANS